MATSCWSTLRSRRAVNRAKTARRSAAVASMRSVHCYSPTWKDIARALLNARRCSAVHTRGKVMMRAPSSALGLISLDHLIRPQQQRRRDGEAEGLGRLEVDDQFELRGLLDGEVGGFRAFEDLVHISRGTTGQVV